MSPDKKNSVSKVKSSKNDVKVAIDVLKAARSKKEVLELTIRIFEQLGFKRIRIWLINKDKNEFYGAKCNYVDDKRFQKIRGDLSSKKTSPYLTHAYTKKKPFFNRNNYLIKGYFDDYKTKETVEFPLVGDKEILGSIGVDNGPSGERIQLKEIGPRTMPFVNLIAQTLQEVLADEKIRAVNESLKSSGQILQSARSKKEVLDFAVRIFRRLGFDRVRIWLLDLENNVMRGGKSSYISDKKFQNVSVDLDKQDGSNLPVNYLKIINERKPFTNTTFPILKKFFNEKKLKHSVETPLFAGKRPIGLISVDNAITGRPLEPSRMEELMPLINYVGATIDQALLGEKLKEKNAELKKLANIDSLSGLPNRRMLDEKLAAEFQKSTPQRPLTFAMIDIDFLKQINDTRGHVAGDKAIVKIGEVLKYNRGIDFAARFAGDEFIVLFFGKNHETCQQTLEKIISKIKKIGLSVSIGSAKYPSPGVKSPIDLMRAADDALYHAKHTGRGKLVCVNCDKEKIIPLSKRRKELQEIEKEGSFAADKINQLEAIIKISNQLRFSETEKNSTRNGCSYNE
jgi:diguanylate cyclase (GGDEF)-like protein